MNARVAAGLALLALALAFFASHRFDPDARRLVRGHAVAFSGDEPHYAVVLHSLLFDGDLRVDDDYRAAAAGGPESGSVRAGKRLDHHSHFVDVATGETALWQDHFDYTRGAPCDAPGCVPFQPTRPLPFPVGPDTPEVPAHPPAFPALLAAAILPFDVAPGQVEAAASVVLFAISLASVGVAYALGTAAGLGAAWSLAAAALLALASPWLPYVKAFFPETSAGLCFTLALWWLLRGRVLRAGAALAAAAVFKPAFAAVGVAWIAERWLAGDRRAAARLLAPLAAAGAALLAFNAFVLGPLAVIGASGFRANNPAVGALKTLVSLRLGVVWFAPWAVLALPPMLRRAAPDGDRRPRLGRFVGCALLLYLPLISIPWALGADCYGPRYWVAFMPCLAVLATDTARRGGPRLRAAALALAVAGAAWAVPAALLYTEVWNRPPWAALLRLAAGPG